MTKNQITFTLEEQEGRQIFTAAVENGRKDKIKWTPNLPN